MTLRSSLTRMCPPLALLLAACGGQTTDHYSAEVDDDARGCALGSTRCAPGRCAPGSHAFAKLYGGKASDFGNGLAIDRSGNIYLSASFAYSVEFCGAPVQGVGFQDSLVAMLEPDGRERWVHSIGAGEASADMVAVAAVDGGGVLAAGSVTGGAVDLGTGPLAGSGDAQDLALLELSRSGRPLWSRRYPSPASATALDVEPMARGGLVVSGHFAGTLDLGGGEHTSTGPSSAFVARFGPEGEPVWLRSYSGPGGSTSPEVAVTPSGDVLVAVTAIDAPMLPPGSETGLEAAPADAFLVLLGGDGRQLWARSVDFAPLEPCSCRTLIKTLAVDAEGGIWLGGGSEEPVYAHSHLGRPQWAFASRLAPDGAPLWERRFSGTVTALAPLSPTDVIVAGTFLAETELGDETLTAQGFADIFAARLATDDSVAWARAFGTHAFDAVAQLRSSPVGNVVLTGTVGDELVEGSIRVDFGEGAAHTADRSDAFVLALGQ